MDIINFFIMSINLAAVFIFGSTGESITEKSGHLNMGIPGIACLGFCGSVLGANIYLNSGIDNAFLAFFIIIFFAILVSGFGGLIFAFFTVTLKCNQTVTGLTLTTFGVGLNTFIVSTIGDNPGYSNISFKYFQHIFPESFYGANDFARLFFSYGFLFYLAIILAVSATIFLKKTRIGLNLRACGENPSVADAAGINVTRYRYLAITIGAMIAGLSGTFLFMNHFKGALEYDISSYGWLAVALVIFAMWNPSLSILGSIIFSLFYCAPAYFNFGTYGKLATALPYLITIIVLIITSIVNKKETQGPAALGLTYFREDR